MLEESERSGYNHPQCAHAYVNGAEVLDPNLFKVIGAKKKNGCLFTDENNAHVSPKKMRVGKFIQDLYMSLTLRKPL